MTATPTKAADLAGTIEAGHKAATDKYSAFKASAPCIELLCSIMDAVEAEEYNVEDALNAQGIKNPKRADRVGIFIDKLIEISEKSQHPLNVLNGRECYYNGKYWEYVNPEDFGWFLTKAAQTMGVQQYEAMFCDFVTKTAQSFKTATRVNTIKTHAAVCTLNCLNGTVEIREGRAKLREHRSEDGFLYVLPYNYDPEATAPRFEAFLNEVLPSAEDRANVCEFCGSLFSDIRHERLLYLYGATGRNGKSTFENIITAALGPSNISNESLSNLTSNNGTGEASRAALEGKLLNACGEVDHKITSGQLLKQLASRNAMSVRPPYSRSVHKIPEGGYARLMFCCNSLPVFTQGAASAEARRFLFIEFMKQIPLEKVNLRLAEEIADNELPGVLNWMIRGAQSMAANRGRFTENPHSELITSQFLEGSNSIYAYLKEYGIVAPTAANINRYYGKEEKVSLIKFHNNPDLTGDLAPGYRESYTEFCKSNGRLPMGRNSFLAGLRSMGFEYERTRSERFIKLYVLREDEVEALRAGQPPLKANAEIEFPDL